MVEQGLPTRSALPPLRLTFPPPAIPEPRSDVALREHPRLNQDSLIDPASG